MMARNSTVYVGANDPQIAGLAIMGAALVWFLRRWQRQASPTPALLLMVIAGFWKHNNVAIPLTSLAWLYVDRSQYSHRALAVSTVAVLVGLTACVLVFGPNFIPDLLAPQQYAWSNILGQIGHLQWSALALVIWAACAFFDRESQAAKFTALHIGLALATCILQWCGHGVFGNAEFDLILALAIGLGVTFNRMEATWLAARIGVNRCQDAMIVSLLLRLFLSDRQETALLLLSPEFRASLYVSERNALNEAHVVAAKFGDVACFTKLVCRQAGKPFTVDEFKTDELVATGKATPADIVALLKANRIEIIQRRCPPERKRARRFRSGGGPKPRKVLKCVIFIRAPRANLSQGRRVPHLNRYGRLSAPCPQHRRPVRQFGSVFNISSGRLTCAHTAQPGRDAVSLHEER